MLVMDLHCHSFPPRWSNSCFVPGRADSGFKVWFNKGEKNVTCGKYVAVIWLRNVIFKKTIHSDFGVVLQQSLDRGFSQARRIITLLWKSMDPPYIGMWKKGLTPFLAHKTWTYVATKKKELSLFVKPLHRLLGKILNDFNLFADCARL